MPSGEVSADELLAAVEALRQDRPERALPTLERALAAPSSDALRGRLLGLKAQALLASGQAEEAREPLRQAMAIARRLDDAPGLHALRSLNGRVYARIAGDAEQARLREAEALETRRPLLARLAEAEGAEARALVLLAALNAEVERGETGATARDLATRALAEADAAPADQVKARVLVRLTLARMADTPEARRAWFDEALDIADAADEANLVTAVARAAEAAGLPFAPRVFGGSPG